MKQVLEYQVDCGFCLWQPLALLGHLIALMSWGAGLFRFAFRGCCVSCLILSDDFNRASSSSLGSDWIEVAGDFDIVANQMQTSTVNSLAVTKATGDSWYTTCQMSLSLYARGRIIVDYLDNDNYLCAEIMRRPTYLQMNLQARRAGLTSWLTGDTYLFTDTTDTCTIQVCYQRDDLFFAACQSGGTRKVRGAITATLNGSKAGFSIPSSGTMKIDNFEWSKHFSEDEDCSQCDAGCSECTVAIGQNLVIDFGAGGWTNDECGACDQVADEIEVESIGKQECLWEWCEEYGCMTEACDDGGTCCNVIWGTKNGGPHGGFGASLNIVSESGGLFHWKVTVKRKACGQYCVDPCDNAGCFESVACEAIYTSDSFRADECDNFPFNLSKDSEVVSGTYCGGSLPGTITLDQA